MKKVLLILVLALLVLGTVSAEGPQFFGFNIGGMVSYNLATQDIAPSSPFGLQFFFDDTFSAGFCFDKGLDLTMLNLSFTPLENVNVSLYTGQENTPNVIAFGMGFGYDFLVNPERLFSSVGIYMNWFGTQAGTYDVNAGGVLSMGMKMSFGI